jgi:hippurate hydrolase
MKQALPVIDDRLFSWMRDIRRTLHRHPELSFKEFNTSALIQEKLKDLQISAIGGFAGTGVVARLQGKTAGGLGKRGHVALRADMDALPVEEKNDVSYASQMPGVMHACGHDGHVAMLLGAAALVKQIDLRGDLSLIFQPAEEHGNGAEKMIKAGALDAGVQAIFAGHIDTHFPTGTITVDEGPICAWADPFSIALTGKSGHAARPHEAHDTIVAGAHLVTALQTLVSRETDPNLAAVVTIGRFQAGHAHNIIADKAILDGTIRTSDMRVRERILSGIQRLVYSVGEQFLVQTEIQFHDSLPAVVNSQRAADVARAAALGTVGEQGVISQGRPSLGSEDFSFYQQHVEGCMVRFGAAGTAAFSPAHSGTFDFDEQVLAVGAEWLCRVALQWLAESQ